jgi:hypothetical protein
MQKSIVYKSYYISEQKTKYIDVNKNIVRFQNAYHVTVIKHIHVANYIIKQLIVLIIYKRQILHVQCYKSLYIDVYRIFVNEYIKRIKENKTLQKCTFLMK